nr:hypothetical protein [Tanacetum cinerariifolium]
MTPHSPIYKIHHPPSPCNHHGHLSRLPPSPRCHRRPPYSLSSPSATLLRCGYTINTTTTTTPPLQRLRRTFHPLPLHHRDHQHHATTTNATATTTAATAAAFPAAAAVVAGCGWQIGRHRHGGAYKSSDLVSIFSCMVVTSSVKAIFNLVVDGFDLVSNRGCPPPNHHRGGGRTTVQPPQPHLVMSSCDGATPWGVSQ